MTNETKHTPAPWIISQTSSPTILSINSDNGVSVADVWGISATGLEMQANAHLIAAAPELLEALNYIASLKTPERIQRDIDAMEGSLCPDYNQTITGIYKVMQNTAKAAIAKAEGK